MVVFQLRCRIMGVSTSQIRSKDHNAAANRGSAARYSTMDNIDGKQARRTGQSSGLGELFE